MLGCFSNLLASNPHLIRIEDEEFVVLSPLETHRKLEGFRKADFDGEKIASLLKESEDARNQYEKTARRLKELGG